MPMSCSVMMLGWVSWPTTRASCRKRSRASPRARSAEKSLTATGRPIIGSKPRTTRLLANDAGFVQEAIAGVAAREVGGKELDGDGAADHWIKAANDAAGGAYAEGFEGLVGSDLHGTFLFRDAV